MVVVMRWWMIGGLLWIVVAMPAWADRSDARDMVAQAQGMLQNPTAEQLRKAEARIREALAEYDKPFRGNILRGGDYFPYYHLGRVLQLQGQCRDALSAWQTSLEHDAVRGDERADLLRLKAACETTVRNIGVAKAKADQAVEQADMVRAAVERLGRQKVLQPIWSQGTPSLASRLRDGVTALDGARRQIADADRQLDVAAMAAAEAQAANTAEFLKAVERDAKARRAELDRVRSEALEALEAVESRAERTLRWASRLAPYPPEVGAAVEALETVRSTIETRRDVAEPAELNQLRDQLTAARSQVARRVAAPPDALTSAAESYLAGDHAAVVATVLTALGRGTVEPGVEPPAPAWDDAKATFHALTLLAASQHALWALGGERDAELLAASEAALHEAAALEVPAGTRVGERFFPPAFRALVDLVAAQRVTDADSADDDPQDDD